MGTWWLIGGIFGLVYAVGVGYFGGVKKNATLLKMTKMKLDKNMSDEKAAKIDLVMGIIMGVVGVGLLIAGAIIG